MTVRLFAIVFIVALAAGVLFGRLDGSSAAAAGSTDGANAGSASRVPEPLLGATLLPGLGNYHFAASTSSPEAQRWFDQALMLTFGFNHDAAERSYLRATTLDPDCAMCWWGAALVVGPHVNAAMEPENNAKAWRRLQRAVALAPKASKREQAFIRALEARYAENPPDDRRTLDEAYAKATRQLAAENPGDLDAATFHAEALMDTQPWAYYDEKLQPVGNTAEVVSTLESVLARNPDHAFALHLHVHAMEASAEPERAAAAADRLRDLIPGSGHLVHMPAHIYSRVGRWHDAVVANQKAIAADDQYLSMCRGNAQGVYPLGYVPHNHHFLWFAASMEGASKLARAAAAHTAERTNLPDLMRQPGFAGLQHFWMTPWFDDVRFQRWADIAGKPNPAPDLPYPTAIWNYAQALAAIGQRRLDDADRHYVALSKLAADPVMETLTVWDRYPLSHAAQIAERMVKAELSAVRGDRDTAIAALRDAVVIEDRIPYDEPPGWHSPVRQSLGALYLRAGRAADAEAIFREELRRNPENAWSLQGLAFALDAQQRAADAQDVRRRLDAVTQHADVEMAELLTMR